MEDKDAVFKWLVDKKEEPEIEVVTKQMLEEILEEEEFVIVLYTGTCEGKQELCEELLEHLEELDDEFDTKGVAFVQTPDEEYPLLKHSLTKLPAIGIYRNRDHFLLYEGDLLEKVEISYLVLGSQLSPYLQDDISNWLNDVENLKIDGKIEKVNEKLLAYLYDNEDNLVVFFYEETDRDADEIAEGLETIDDELDVKDFTKVKTCDKGIEINYGLIGLPKVVYFQSGIPIIFTGNIIHNFPNCHCLLQSR